MYFAVFESAFGWCSFLSCEEKIAMCTFGLDRQNTAFQRVADFARLHDIELDEHTDEHPFVDQVKRYTSGARETFTDVAIVDDHMTSFQKRVVGACRQIGYGRTRSYGDIAKRAGSPRAARAVGNVMRNNRTPLLVPCHRVVSSCGIGGYSASAGVSMKKRLLAMERANSS